MYNDEEFKERLKNHNSSIQDFSFRKIQEGDRVINFIDNFTVINGSEVFLNMVIEIDNHVEVRPVAPERFKEVISEGSLHNPFKALLELKKSIKDKTFTGYKDEETGLICFK